MAVTQLLGNFPLVGRRALAVPGGGSSAALTTVNSVSAPGEGTGHAAGQGIPAGG